MNKLKHKHPNAQKSPIRNIEDGDQSEKKLRLALCAFQYLGVTVLNRIAADLSCENPFDEEGKPTNEAIEEALEIAEQACREYLDQDHSQWFNCDVLAHSEENALSGEERWAELQQKLATKPAASAHIQQ